MISLVIRIEPYCGRAEPPTNFGRRRRYLMVNLSARRRCHADVNQSMDWGRKQSDYGSNI